MDISSDLRDSFIRPPSLIMNPLRGSVDGCCSQSGGLMRYHSAPSSTFAALLEPDLFSANDAAELVHFLEHNNVNDFGSFGDAEFPLKQHRKQTSSSKNMQPQQAYSAHNDVLLQHSVPEAVTFQEHIGQGPLCAIFEHAGDEHCLPQPIQGNSTANASNGAAIHSDSQYRSNLIRHSSLPTDFVSRLAMADMSERPMGSQQATSHVQSSSQQAISRLQTTSAGTTDNLGGKVYLKTSRMSPRGVPVIKGLTDDSLPCKKDEYQALDNELNQPCGLLRQSSSPAGLLSQLSLDEFGSPADKAVSPSTPSSSSGRWDEASMDFAMHNIAALSQRKRGREIDARLLKSLPTADLTVIDQITSPLNLYSAVAASNNDMTDAVLCKSRAKRGCATHPRSIAERVRRTKISERIKKLQDLVPNLDKQAHTADMLDEIVEYVKLLQRRVEELSNQSHVCNGTCQKKEDNPVQA